MAELRTVTKTVMIDSNLVDAQAPVPGARKVFWLLDGQWIPKGWLMPTVTTYD